MGKDRTQAAVSAALDMISDNIIRSREAALGALADELELDSARDRVGAAQRDCDRLRAIAARAQRDVKDADGLLAAAVTDLEDRVAAFNRGRDELIAATTIRSAPAQVQESVQESTGAGRTNRRRK
jgi:hypothetical protein